MKKPKVHSVLVKTKNAANIGSSARATANLSEQGRLILVAPRTSINSQARKMAAGAQDILDQHLSYPDWESFLQDHGNRGVRLALTRRQGKQRKTFSLPEAIQRNHHVKENRENDIYLVFGPEEDGLNREDLDQCHLSCFLPAYGQFKSLNLAQAVLLAHYITQQNLEKLTYGKEAYAQGSLQQFYDQLHEDQPDFPNTKLKKALASLFSNSNDQVLSNSFDTIKRMILRSIPSQKELDLFSLILQKSLDLSKRKPEDTNNDAKGAE